MVRYAHFVKRNFFGIFKKTVRSPDAAEKLNKIVSGNLITNFLPVQPFHVQYSVLFAHVFW